MFFEIYLRHRWIRTIFLLFVILLYSNLCLSWAPILIHLFFNGIQFWIMGSILQNLLDNVLHQTELWKYFWNLSLLTQHSFWVDCESVAAVLSSKGTSVLFLGSPMALGNQALFMTKKSRLKILTSILCLPQCPCVLLSLRPKPKGGAEARHWKTSWKRRSPNAKKQRERKKISHNNDKIENE